MDLEKLKKNILPRKNKPNKADVTNFLEYPVKEFSEELIQSELREYLFFKIEGGLRYDFLLSKKKSKRLFVLFSGYVDRKKLTPPVFQRWKWVEKFPGSVLYVSDPSLHLNKSLSLGWYIGTKEVDCFEVISKIITKVADTLKVPTTEIIGYGSSGGGYASIRMSDFIPEMTSVAINPQTEIRKYWQKESVNNFLKVCFKESYRDFDFETYGDRFNLIKDKEVMDGKKVILAQNIIDEHHYYEHFLPYCVARGVDGSLGFNSDTFKAIIFENKSGHSGAETNEVFNKIISML